MDVTLLMPLYAFWQTIRTLRTLAKQQAAASVSCQPCAVIEMVCQSVQGSNLSS